jgi:predicted O-linked N-acetylglucosamine transferase (SPINDLY family)
MSLLSGSQLDETVWGLINHHDRRQFEVHLFSDAPASQISMAITFTRKTISATTGLSNEALSQQIQHAGIDLLVDLNGYSTMGRLPLFALRRSRSSWVVQHVCHYRHRELRLPDR